MKNLKEWNIYQLAFAYILWWIGIVGIINTIIIIL